MRELVISCLQCLSFVLCNPNLGGGSSLQSHESSALLRVLSGLLDAEEGEDDLDMFTEIVEGMRDENRSPTPDEWKLLLAMEVVPADAVEEEVVEDAQEEESSSDEGEGTPVSSDPPGVPDSTPPTPDSPEFQTDESLR